MFSHHKRHHNRRDELLMNKHGPRINQTIFLKKKPTRKKSKHAPLNLYIHYQGNKVALISRLRNLNFQTRNFISQNGFIFESKNFDPCRKFLKTTKGSWSA